MTDAHQPTGPYVGVIADMVASRELSPPDRSRVQERFTELIETLNDQYSGKLAAKFVITLGDEFQGLLNDPEVIPQFVWLLEQRFTVRKLRVGFGYGQIHTALREYAINVDGPALHNARFSIEAAKRGSLNGGVFTGFGATLDPALNGFARALEHQRATWPRRQRQVVERLNTGLKGIEVAEELGITKQAVSRYAALAGWEAYVEAQRGWSVLLRSVGERQ
jgi:hypothetical protein